MSNNNSFPSQGFLPDAIRTFLWGRATEQPQDPMANRQGQFLLAPFVTYAYKYLNLFTILQNELL